MSYTTVIEPKRSWFDVDLRGLWRYRDLYVMYIKRDIITQYKQTVLGPLWFFIQPLFTTVIYMFVFGGLAGISTDGVPQPLFYLAGIMMWNYFSVCFGSSSNVFTANAGVFGKVYFPRLVVPLSACTSSLIKLLIQFGIFLVVYFYYLFTGGIAAPSLGSVLLALVACPVLVLMLAMHAMSWGLIISSFTTKYRDLTFFVQFGMSLLMYATPVIYPLSFAPEAYRNVIELNPLTPIFEATKYSLVGSGSFSLTGLLYSAGLLALTLTLGVLAFSRTEKTFMDTV